MKKIKEFIPYIIIVVFVILIRTYIVTPAIVNGGSMEETLYDGDLVLVDKISLKKGIERFDIVVVEVKGSLLIKRVIGLPNERISYVDDELFINNELIDLPMEFRITEDFEGETFEDEYFLLGDNRTISKDSRILGAFKSTDIKGKVNVVLFPFSRLGSVE